MSEKAEPLTDEQLGRLVVRCAATDYFALEVNVDTGETIHLHHVLATIRADRARIGALTAAAETQQQTIDGQHDVIEEQRELIREAGR